MKIHLEQVLYLSAAVLALAAGIGLDPLIAALSTAAINVAFACSARRRA
jgi:hypothetical protein